MRARRTLALLGLALAAVVTDAAGPAAAPMSSRAGAPGPAASGKATKADLLFTLTANTANFTSPTTLVLGGLSYTAQFTSSSTGRVGVYPIGLFTNSSDPTFQSANGQWLGNPQAILYGTAQDGNMTAVILSLDTPKYNPLTDTATFAVEVVTPAKGGARYSGGAVASSIADASKGVGPAVLTAVNATTELRATALFIDTDRLALGRAAETKWWGWGGGCGGGWGGGGWYQPVYYQPVVYYQPWGGGCGCCGCGWGKK